MLSGLLNLDLMESLDGTPGGGGGATATATALLLARRLRQAERAADDVVALLRVVGREGAAEEGTGGMVPGRVLERLMLAYLGLKVRQLVCWG